MLKKLLMTLMICTTIVHHIGLKSTPLIYTRGIKQININKISFVLSRYKNTKLNADTIYKYCNEYDIDWKFCLSVGIVETQLGTDPKAYRAKRNNTVWSVGEVDNGKSHRRYNTVHEASKGFCSLINRMYKSTGKTEQELLHKFTNINGRRYASSKSYEKILKSIYIKL